ncbi:fimbrial protein [Morganella morganii]|uniref:fimbrial protein n=1 Tax=Morganella morganii TaxID=582 RepID=UPI0034D6DAEE
MMKTSAAVLLLFLTVISSRAAYATCSVTSTQTAPAVALDLSADLIGATTTVSKVSQTNFSGPFTCTTALPLFPNTIGIDSPFNGRTATIGFNNGAQLVNITLTALTKNNVSGLAAGTHNGTELNTGFTLRFDLVTTPTGNYTKVPGNTVTITPVIFASDATTLGLVGWLAALLNKILQFLLTLQWPADPNDMFLQPVQITYNPPVTTCTFTNAGLTVSLPLMSINAVKTTDKAGYTPFRLNFTCGGLLPGNTASRDIAMFLSSSNLQPSDKTVLTNTVFGGAGGVGFRVVKANNLSSPVQFSDSANAQGSATSIFTAAKGSAVSPAFSVDMGAYYYPYSPGTVTQGKMSSSATLVFSYN